MITKAVTFEEIVLNGMPCNLRIAIDAQNDEMKHKQ